MGQALPPEIERVLVSTAQIAATVDRLAADLARDYRGRNPVLVGALTGAVVLMADLVRRLDFPLTVDFVAVHSYGNQSATSGTVQWRMDLATDIRDRHVVIVEDIVDSGVTLHALQATLAEREPASLAICTLLNKASRRRVRVPLGYVGMEIPDEFVVGYGLDFAQQFRHLPYVGVLRREVYA
jgi:hypoxanthine phosphoribosyltransferase